MRWLPPPPPVLDRHLLEDHSLQTSSSSGGGGMQPYPRLPEPNGNFLTTNLSNTGQWQDACSHATTHAPASRWRCPLWKSMRKRARRLLSKAGLWRLTRGSIWCGCRSFQTDTLSSKHAGDHMTLTVLQLKLAATEA